MSDDNLFLEHKHPVSGLLAVLEDDGASAWLYMSDGDSRRPIADAWVYNRIAAPALEAIQSYRGGPRSEEKRLRQARADVKGFLLVCAVLRVARGAREDLQLLEIRPSHALF